MLGKAHKYLNDLKIKNGVVNGNMNGLKIKNGVANGHMNDHVNGGTANGRDC